MPLYKRKPFHLVETPKDLKPHEPVFQIRFTKEIFRAYGFIFYFLCFFEILCEYLNRINLYRQRVWTCKVSAKCNLTYEEALVSEKRAAEKVQQFPKELVVPVLRDVQFSMLTLKDLVNRIVTKLQEGFLEGVELQGRKNNRIYPCKIVKVLQESDKARYQVDWLDKDKKITGHDVVSGEDLIKKKLPISRDVLKSFIRESTYRSVPWVLHNKLARKHGISIDPPEEMRGKISLQDGRVVCDRKRKKREEDRCNGVVILRIQVKKVRERSSRRIDLRPSSLRRMLRKCLPIDIRRALKSSPLSTTSSANAVLNLSIKMWLFEFASFYFRFPNYSLVCLSILEFKFAEEGKGKKEPIKYPIDDLLVQPGSDDPAFTQRPSPSREFNIPMDCVGDLLMVWNFCSSFGRLLQLSPFSLEDFENALCHKDSNVILIVESHSTLLRLLMKDNGDYAMAIQKKKRKPKMTIITWIDFLCDFLEMVGVAELSTCITTIRRGHYGLLDVRAKLGIFRELIGRALSTDLVREKLDEDIEETQLLAATRRGEALEEGRRMREDKERLKVESSGKEVKENSILDSVFSNSNEVANGSNRPNGDVVQKWNGKVLPSRAKHTSRNRFYVLKCQLVIVPGQKHARYICWIEYENFFFPFFSGCMQMDPLPKKNAKKHKAEAKATVGGIEEGAHDSINDRKGAMDKRSKEQRKEFLEREMEKRCIRTNSLGKDRNYNSSELQKRSKEEANRILVEEAMVRRSTRVRAPPRDSPAVAFLKYLNKWKGE
ncbi:hypothetical protein RJ640_008233 [Escallonia rubra]|uniref:DDT domain-containing protein n=1 Tax=Escallonia rubra TaxID=112253 RepID=A0AA88QUF7_9ASTE|nr:hypothetical protein RJ640_008233 [Escallonia rubra]